ncbi:hypothetical protein YPPY101_2851, partial [Yersinia pestis PY-101]
MPSQRKDIRG